MTLRTASKVVWVAVGIGSTLVLVVVGAAFFGLLSIGRECTLVGCSNRATFDLVSQPQTTRDAAVTGTICLDGSCSAMPIGEGQPFITVELTSPDVGSASVVLRDVAGVEVARFESRGQLDATITYPNGEGCQPSCPGLRLIGRDGVLEST